MTEEHLVKKTRLSRRLYAYVARGTIKILNGSLKGQKDVTLILKYIQMK